jgi:hypothetical protein
MTNERFSGGGEKEFDDDDLSDAGRLTPLLVLVDISFSNYTVLRSPHAFIMDFVNSLMPRNQ